MLRKRYELPALETSCGGAVVHKVADRNGAEVSWGVRTNPNGSADVITIATQRQEFYLRHGPEDKRAAVLQLRKLEAQTQARREQHLKGRHG